jgi:DNA-binding response OmpR family regulator
VERLMRILLVEDDKDVSRFVAKGLKESGHVIDQAATVCSSPPPRTTT